MIRSQVTSALILVLTYQIGAIRSRRWGLAAVLLVLFTAKFFNESRSIALDQYTSLATILSFYLVYSATCYGRDKRLVLLPVIWFLSFVFRGPVGLVIPAAVVCSYYLWLAKYKRFILAGMVAAVVPALGFACLFLATKLQGGESVLDFTQKALLLKSMFLVVTRHNWLMMSQTGSFEQESWLLVSRSISGPCLILAYVNILWFLFSIQNRPTKREVIIDE